MIDFNLLAERVRKAFEPTSRGVIGLVDDLLGLCRSHQLLFDFQGTHCLVRTLGANAQESLDVPVPKTVFRALLARIAALCNEHRPGSATPYRGEGEIVVPGLEIKNQSSPSTCHVAFTNTPSEQRLEVRFSRNTVANENQFTVLLRDNRTVRVFGHALKYIESQSDSQSSECGSYGILSQVEGSEVLVALFPVREVAGVFNGEIGAAEPNKPEQ